MRLLTATAGLLLLVPVALITLLAGLIWLALRTVEFPFEWLFKKGREFISSAAHFSTKRGASAQT